MVTRGSIGVVKLNPWYAFSVAAVVPVPRSARLALLDSNWKEAMESKYKALVCNETWRLIPRSPEDNIINTKWVFKVKEPDDGSIEIQSPLGGEWDVAD